MNSSKVRRNGVNLDHVSLTSDIINTEVLLEMAKSEKAGAISSFLGTTRDTFEGKIVTRLEYEAYNEMALSSMLEICDKHKLGLCPVKEISVAIVVSSAHRKESIEAAHFAIDELKAVVPVWKKEVYDDGSTSWKENVIK